MTALFLDVQDPRWRQFLRRARHDVYHLPGYVACAARHQEGHPTAFLAEAEGHALLVPLVLRPLPPHLDAPDAWRDATSPYGYPAPLLTPGCPEALTTAFLEGFRDHAAEAQIVSVFLRLHPLLPFPEAPLRAHGTLLRHGQTVFFDLTRPPEVLHRQMRRNHRRDLRTLRNQGFTFHLDQWQHYPTFRRLYEDNMRRVQATAFYFFSEDYFADLRTTLPDHLHLGTVHAPDGTIAAASLFTCTDGLAQHHLCGTAAAFLPMSPIKLMIDEIRRWAAAQGCQALHLGGGLGGREDALFRFKAGFANTLADFFTARLILHPDHYALLTQRAFPHSPPPPDFFPAFRFLQ